MNGYTRLLLLALLGTAPACSNPVGVEADPAVVNLRFDAAGPLADAELLTFRLANGGWRRTVRGRELDYQGPGYWWTNDPVPVPAPGTLDVEVLLGSGLDTVAVARLPFQVERRWSYGLAVYVGRGDPRKFGWVICVPRIDAFPIRAPTIGADSLYLAWGGLPRGAIC